MITVPEGIHVHDHGRARTVRLADLLRELAATRGPEGVATAYLDVSWRDEQQRERVRLLGRTRVSELAKSASPPLATSLGKLERRIEQVCRREMSPPLRSWGGLAVVMAPVIEMIVQGAGGQPLRMDGDLDLMVWTAEPFPPSIDVAAHPLLLGLAALTGGPTSALIAACEARGTSIYEADVGEVDVVETIYSDLPSRHRRGGWSQLRFTHHLAERRAAYLKEAAAHLQARYDGIRRMVGHPPRVLVTGRPDILPDFLAALPARIRDAALRAEEIDPAAPEHEIETRALARLEEQARREADDALAAAESAARAHGPGATGIDAVLTAVAEQRIERLFIDDSLDRRAARCGACGTLAAGLDGGRCRACGGPLEAVDLKEELALEAVRQDAPLHALHRNERLRRDGGVTATLRY